MCASTRRHAAALALVGWYLMAPPTLSFDDASDIKTGRWWAKVTAPVREWQILESFDLARDCEDTKGKLIKAGDSAMDREKAQSYKRAFAIASTQAACIASDDPRLKEK
jgi:hypothetical protein